MAKGDKYVVPHPEPSKSPYFVLVTRVARDGSWADIKVLNWAVMWGKRQPVPFPDDWIKRDWDWDEVNSYVPVMMHG